MALTREHDPNRPGRAQSYRTRMIFADVAHSAWFSKISGYHP